MTTNQDKNYLPDLNPQNLFQKKQQANHLGKRLSELRAELANRDPTSLSSKSGCMLSKGMDGLITFHLNYWEENIFVTYPELIVFNSNTCEPLNLLGQALTIYYLNTADGVKLDERWISFSELDDGKFYTQAFQNYTGKLIGQHFHDNPDSFIDAAIRVSGLLDQFADHSFRFRLFPRVDLLYVCWLGDEDFPSTYQILFNSSVNHYLPTEPCAVAGSILTKKIIGV